MTLERRYEISRLEAFSDAVFAFALTLLVVSLEVPRTYAELMLLLRGFPPFACCFALLIWIWYQHSAFFTKYGLHDPVTATLNAVLLFVVLFYVYPLKYVFNLVFASIIPELRNEGAPETTAQVSHLMTIYGFGFVAVFAVFAFLHYRAWRLRGELALSPLEARDTVGEIGTHLVSMSVGLASVVWAVAAPERLRPLAGFVYFLMGPAHWTYGAVNGRSRAAFLKRAAASSPSQL